MATVTTVLALLAACIGFALLARWLKVPYAAVLVLGGMALAFAPGVPAITLDPALALAFFLPPLLQASAWRTDWRAFRSELRPILLLAVGAVLFSALCVAAVAKLILPDLPWAAAIALGAIVAPPDAVAASAVLRGLSMPRRLVVILEGESLVNDATALILYRFSLAALAAGSVALETAGLSFLVVAAGGLVFGYAIGRAAVWAIARTNDTLLETLLSFLACYASFLAGEWAGVSGVIAVVTTGIVLGQKQSAFSARTRVDSVAVWRFVEFVLTSLIFILVGLQLQGILERLGDRDPLLVAGVTLGVSAALLASRFLWVFPVGWIEGLFARRGPKPDPRHLAVISWAGMRGVVSLAAALGLPLETPERDLIVFAAFVALFDPLRVVLSTLSCLKREGSAVLNLLDTGPDLLLRTDAPPTPEDRAALAAFARAERMPRIAWAPGDGAPEIVAQLGVARIGFAGVAVSPPPGAFLQATAEGEAAIRDAVLAGLPGRVPGRRRLVELFAGCGTLTLALARHAPVLAFEGAADAVAALDAAARAAVLPVTATRRDLDRQPLLPAELREAAAVVLDPPYAGAAAQMPLLARAGVPRVILVSCNPAALARDGRVLRDAGYRVLAATPIDQFPWSAHIESVVTFATP